jgi:hypothetical protein
MLDVLLVLVILLLIEGSEVLSKGIFFLSSLMVILSVALSIVVLFPFLHFLCFFSSLQVPVDEVLSFLPSSLCVYSLLLILSVVDGSYPVSHSISLP